MIDWIIVYDGTKGKDAYSVKCLRCGIKQKFPLPIAVSKYLKAIKAFENTHKGCKVTAPPK